MEKINISYKGGLDKFIFRDIFNTLDKDKIQHVDVGSTYNIWQDILNFRLEFRGGKLYFIFKNLRSLRDESDNVKQESEKEIELQDIEIFYRIFEVVGLTEVATTHSYYFRINYDGYDIFVRHSTDLGFFWEVGISIDKEKAYEINNHKKEIKKIISKLNLKSWDRKTQEILVRESNYNYIPVKYSLKDGWISLEKQILKYFSDNRVSVSLNGLSNMRIIDVLNETNNDYSKVELYYRDITNNELLDEKYDNSLKNNIDIYKKIIGNTSCSFVIPFYNDSDRIKYLLKSIEGQMYIEVMKNKLEIVIVDDGSDEKEKKSLHELVNSFPNLNINVTSSDINLGRSRARNIGIQVSTGNIIFFVDSDVVLPNNYIIENLFMQKLFPKTVLISLKENISQHDERLETLSKRGFIEPANINPNDFRGGKTIHPEGKGFNKINHDAMVSMHVSCIEQTDHFKNFGNGITCGVWELPYMLITHNVVVSREAVHRVGGFSEDFKGWGLEDSYLGAKLIADEYYLIPSMKTPVLHINHSARGGEQEQYQEFIKNVDIYKGLITRKANE